LDNLVEVECAIKPLGFTPAKQFIPHRPAAISLHDQSFIRAVEMDQARLARTKAETAAIIAAAAAAQKAAEERALVEAAAAAEEQSKEEERKAERERRRKERKEREERRHNREGDREKRLLKLVGAIVVKTMSKYRSRMDVDMFKKHAKEVKRFRSLSPRFVFAHTAGMCFLQLTHIIAEKEKKSSSYRDKDNKLDELSDEKKTKIKKFAREYIHKVLHKLEKGKRHPPDSRPGSTSAPSSRADTTMITRPSTSTLSPQDENGDAEEMDMDMDMDMEVDMSVEEAMDFSADEDDEPTPVEPAESDTSTAVASATSADPRLRARAAAAVAATGASFATATPSAVEAKGKGWDMLGSSLEFTRPSTTAAS